MGCFVYSLLINPAMVWFSLGAYLHNFPGAPKDAPEIQIPTGAIWAALVATTALCLLGLGLLIGFAKPSHRHTFYKHRPLKRLFAELWETRETAQLGKGLDASRADLLGYSPYYWPAGAQGFLARWGEWESLDEVNRPVWFTTRWQATIIMYAPVELLPREVSEGGRGEIRGAV